MNETSSEAEDAVTGRERENTADKAEESVLKACFAAEDELLGEHVEEVLNKGQRVRRKGVYLVPNLLTTGAMFMGFYAIVSGLQGRFDHAGLAIFFAMLFDGMDGRVARQLNAQSAFGVEYDSLSDLIAFGVAPALIVYNWGLESLGKFGIVAAFMFIVCAALRLARFNTEVTGASNRFAGLASPPAAALVAFTVWILTLYEIEHTTLTYGGLQTSWLVAMLVIVVGLLMVSRLPYISFKDLFDPRGRVPFKFVLFMLLLFALILIDPPHVLMAMAISYTVSGPMWRVWRLLRRRSH